jgi:hypothetical protein
LLGRVIEVWLVPASPGVQPSYLSVVIRSADMYTEAVAEGMLRMLKLTFSPDLLGAASQFGVRVGKS